MTLLALPASSPPQITRFLMGNTESLVPGGSIQWARPMAYRTDSDLADFHIEVDVTDYSNASQNIGIQARHSKPGFGGNLGYLLNYHPLSRSFQLWRSTADHPSGIARLKTSSVDLGESKGFRLVFKGSGDALTGEIFPLNDPNNALAKLEAKDSTFDSGLVGLVTIATGGNIRTDATFDNFIAYDPNCPPLAPEPLADLLVKQIERVGEQVSLTVDGAIESESLVVLRSVDLDLWQPVEHIRNGRLLEFSNLVEKSEYFRIGHSLKGAKLALTVSGRTVSSDEEACQEIIQHIPAELAEGAAARIFLKDTGRGDFFEAYTSEFALDVFFANVPGFDGPQPVASAGWIIQTQEDGSKVFWNTRSEFQPDASSKVRSVILWGTDRFHRATGAVAGVSIPEDPTNPAESAYNYRDTGWIRIVGGD